MTAPQKNVPNVYYFRYITGYNADKSFNYQYGYLDGTPNNTGTNFSDINGTPYISNTTGRVWTIGRIWR